MKFQNDFILFHPNQWIIAPSPLRPDQNLVLDWRALLLEHAGTARRRTYLIQSCKEFLFSWITSARTGRLSGGTILGIYGKMRRLVRWMVARNIWCFSELTKHHMVCYLLDITEGRTMAMESAKKHALLFHKMWELRTEYIGPLQLDPTFLFHEHRIFGGLRRRTSWKPVDEKEALPLIRDALNWMRESVPLLHLITTHLWSAGLLCVGESRYRKKKMLSSAYGQLEGMSAYLKLRDRIGMHDADSRRVVRRLLALTEGATAIIVLFLVGMRVSELLSLDVDSVQRRLHSDGHTHGYLRGIAAKKNGKQREWIATPDVTEALLAMNKLFDGPRCYSKLTYTFLAFNGNYGYPMPGRRLWRVNSGTIGARMRRFANAEFRSNAPISSRLHPHAARKTFARFVVLRDKRALGALAHHYGHTHRSFTDSNYVGDDLELATMISEENRRDLAAGLNDILRSSNVSGKASGLLRVMSEKNKVGKSIRGRKTISRLAERLIDEGVTLAPCDWGYCVYSQAHSACGGDSNGPNQVERAPDVCAKCTNFVVTDTHRNWWEERARDASAFLSRPGLPTQTIAVVERRRQAAESVLRTMNSSMRKVPRNDGK